MLLLDVNANATVCVNGVKVTGSHAVKDGDVVLMGFGCLFRVCTSGNDGEVDWREALQGLHTDLTLSEGTPWERIGEEKLVDELQQMTIVGNHIARSKERDVHRSRRTHGPGRARPCVLSRPLRPKSPIYGMPRNAAAALQDQEGVDPDPYLTLPTID